MAISTIRNSLTDAIKKYTDTGMRNLLKKRGINQVRITGDRSVDAFIEGTKKLMRGARYEQEYVNTINSEYNTPEVWKDVLSDIFNKLDSLSSVVETNHNLKSLPQIRTTTLDNVYILAGSTPDNIVIRLYSGMEVSGGNLSTNLNRFLEQFRILAFKEWQKRLPTSDTGLTGVNVEKSKKGGTRFAKLSNPQDPEGQYALGAFGAGNPFAHDNETTVGKFGLQAILNDLGDVNQSYQEAINYRGLQNFEIDLMQSITDNLTIEYTESTIDMPDGGTRIIRKTEVGLIEGELREQGKEFSDWTNIKRFLLREGGLERAIQKQVDVMNRDQALEAEGSPAARKQLADKAAKAIVDSIVTKNPRAKAVKRKRVQKSKPKKINLTGKGIVKKKVKKLPTSAKVAVAGKRLQNRDKQEQGKTNTTIGLAKLKARLNRRLPAEVRRNMGRPALENRTGRFSNSVYITSLKQAQKTIVGEYTYQLSPYETFENTGERRWPNGYNPKPLITKSIRNLAMGIVEDKFTLRRV